MREQRAIEAYIEPVYRFCAARLYSKYDAEDLASEIFAHVLDGMGKYDIQSLDAWVWRVARNRYARFIESRRRNKTEELAEDKQDDYDFIDELCVREEHSAVFNALMSLSEAYRCMAVDFYVNELSVKEIASRYALSEATVKWRLNVSREKIKDRMENIIMNRIYERINWDTNTCNGNTDPSKYLSGQMARAICRACYDKPLTVEDISAATGIPALYIEDELSRLVYGNAVEKTGNKYATDFIVLSLSDRREMDKRLASLVSLIADRYEELFALNAARVTQMGFYGADRGIGHLGHIALPASLRTRLARLIKEDSTLEQGAFPPHNDGSYGWFTVSETEDADERVSPYTSGLCVSEGEKDLFYYNWIKKYMYGYDLDIYYEGGVDFMFERGLMNKAKNGVLPADAVSENDAARLISYGLIKKCQGGYALSFPCFEHDEYIAFENLFAQPDAETDGAILELMREVKASFTAFTPKRLSSQINQYAAGVVYDLTGYVTEALVERGVLTKPEEGMAMADGVAFVYGEQVDLN